MEISSSRAAADFLRVKIGKRDVEEFWALALNPLCEVIDVAMLFRGTADCCFVHPRDVFRFALAANASSLLVGHNHPSGQCQPSRADVVMSGRLKDAGVLLQIPVVDHIIVTSHDDGQFDFFSFAESLWKNDVRGKKRMTFRT